VSKEDLASLPKIDLKDLDREAMQLDREVTEDNTDVTIFVPGKSRGLIYLDLALNIANLNNDEIKYLPAVAEQLAAGKTNNLSLSELTLGLEQYTDGITYDYLISRHIKNGTKNRYLLLSTKMLPENIEKVSELLHEILLNPDYTELDQLKKLLRNNRRAMLDSLIQRSYVYTYLHSKAMLEEDAALQEELEGLQYIHNLNMVIEEIENAPEKITKKLERVHKKLISTPKKIYTVTSEDKLREDSISLTESLKEFIKKEESLEVSDSYKFKPDSKTTHLLSLPTNIVNSAIVNNSEDIQIEDSLINKSLFSHLRYTYLWDEIRAKGGAYSTMTNISSMYNHLYFISYRDPNLNQTLETFKNTPKYLRDIEFDKDLKRDLIMKGVTIVDPYIDIEDLGAVVLNRYLQGTDGDIRQKMKDRLFEINDDHIKQIADVIEGSYNNSSALTIIGSEQIVYEELGDNFKKIELE
jgi:hypothetical protein